MHDFSARALRPELLDGGGVPDPDARRALLDLRRINKLFGGKRILLKSLAREVSRHGLSRFSVLDIGSGSCDLPMAALDWAHEQKLDAEIFALEYQLRNLRLFRTEIAAYPKLFPFCADAFRAPVRNQTFDFVTCCHFLHHLTEEQAAELLLRMSHWARYSVIVCDLERHPLPYYFFRIFRRFFTTSYVSRIDGLISLGRSFQKKELAAMAERSALTRYTIERHWPFQLVLLSASEP